MLHAVIMAGGAGTRFWPASRADRPKQLLDLAGGLTMIEGTVQRLRGLVPAERILVVTNQRLVPAIQKLLPDVPSENVIGEPCKRDTAPCIGLAALLLERTGGQDLSLLVTPADHVIHPQETFQAAVRQAERLLDEDPSRIITFGIAPTYPAETFGYIERGAGLPVAADEAPTFRVCRFREKPNREQAQEFLATGGFYWNSGIFVWKSRTILQALERHESALYGHLRAIAEAFGKDHFGDVFEHEFSAIKGISIDYAVMERHENVLVVEAPFDWDDVGSWQALSRLRGTDAEGNTVVGRHVGVNTRNCIVRTDDQHLVATLGLSDCIVVHTPDATLVANRSQEEAIREIVQLLENQNDQRYL